MLSVIVSSYSYLLDVSPWKIVSGPTEARQYLVYLRFWEVIQETVQKYFKFDGKRSGSIQDEWCKIMGSFKRAISIPFLLLFLSQMVIVPSQFVYSWVQKYFEGKKMRELLTTVKTLMGKRGRRLQGSGWGRKLNGNGRKIVMDGKEEEDKTRTDRQCVM